MRNNKLILVAIALFVFIAYAANAQSLSNTSIGPHEEGKFRTLSKKTGEVLWQASWTIDKEAEIIHMKEKGSGKYNGSKENISWIMDSSFIAGNAPKVFRTIRTAYSNNKEIWKKSKVFDYPKKRITAQTYISGTLKNEKSIPFPKGLAFTSDILAVILRAYDFDKKDPLCFHIFSSDAKLFKIRTQIIGKEFVNVPAGKFECYKMELILDLGLLNLLTKYFLPKTYMWFTVKEPHTWVKYEGLESGLGSPYVMMELEEFKSSNKE